MNVSLTPELERLVQKKVATGMYHSASEVIREALRLLQEREATRHMRLVELRNDLKLGLQQLDQGRSRPFDGNRIKERLVQRSVSGRTTKRRKSA